jgi:hypothetical protein
MNATSSGQSERARFEQALREFTELSPAEKQSILRSLGILSADGLLTTRFGGDGELDVEAVEAHEKQVQAAFAAARRGRYVRW